MMRIIILLFSLMICLSAVGQKDKNTFKKFGVGTLLQMDFADFSFSDPLNDRDVTTAMQIGLSGLYRPIRQIEFTLEYYFSAARVEPTVVTYRPVINNVNTHYIGPGLRLTPFVNLKLQPHLIIKYFQVLNMPYEFDTYKVKRSTVQNLQYGLGIKILNTDKYDINAHYLRGDYSSFADDEPRESLSVRNYIFGLSIYRFL